MLKIWLDRGNTHFGSMIVVQDLLGKPDPELEISARIGNNWKKVLQKPKLDKISKNIN